MVMRDRFAKKTGAAMLAAGLMVGVAGAASAHPSAAKVANTHMTFHLVDHQVTVGDPVTGPVHLGTKSGAHWVPFAGAALSVRVDGTEVATLTTDADGNATVSYSAATEGDHVVRVVYAGDGTHHHRQRAQGFNAAATTTTSG